LEDGHPFTDPAFFGDANRCPDRLIELTFMSAPQSEEVIPLLRERIAVMRECGKILCQKVRLMFLSLIFVPMLIHVQVWGLLSRLSGTFSKET
jgi:hypothetical protein